MKPMILPFKPESEYFFEEGCYIIEQLNSEADPDLSIARARVSPGGQTRWHSLLNTVERYQILSGTGLVEVGDEPPTEVNPGDTVVIPAGMRQRIRNSGEEELIFLALCTPRFVPEHYQDLED
ncbi:MAG: cupin [Pseudomonadales bacterium]|nr:cupin [Pseudomonadales bacterium]RLU02628.1 MAG: cupin domain-containing protein [Ketobacter sp.]